MEDKNSGSNGWPKNSSEASCSFSGAFRAMDPADYSDRVLQGISALDDTQNHMEFQGFPPLAASSEDATSMEVEAPTENEGQSFGQDIEIVDEDFFVSSSGRTEMLEGGITDEFQHKRVKVSGYTSLVHISGASQEVVGPSSLYETESSLSNATLRSGVQISLPDDTHVEEPMDSCSIGVDKDDCGIMDSRDDLDTRMDLTDDLLHMVFSFLGQLDLCQAARVCRQWRAASAHEDFWKSLNFEKRNISRQQVAQMYQKYPKAIKLNVRGASYADELAREAMHMLRNLEVLILGDVPLSEALFDGLESFPALNRLVIDNATLGNGTQEIHVYHDSLRHLQITKCRVVRVSVRCPQLEALWLTRSTMVHATVACPQLRILNVAFCNKLSDAGVRHVAISCPLLYSLDISKCSSVTDDTLREIAHACSSLCVLDASYCPNISLDNVRLPMLTEIKLQNCEGINASSMVYLSHCLMLQTLQLDMCWLLTSVSLDLPHLKDISLVNCKKFVELNLRCPELSSVNVSHCEVLNRIDITSSDLQKLVLQKQVSLTTMALNCLQLREIDLTECVMLNNSICKIFSDGGGCPMLNTLILDSCESLTVVQLNSSSLNKLSLGGCRETTELKLECPNLRQLNLDGCDHLETASFSPVGLQSLNLGICPRLSKLEIEGPQLAVLELKGCGNLSQALIKCPCLLSLDASFCSQLQDDCLLATTASCQRIESLILSSCPLIGPDGLYALKHLSHLTLLDLSYTFLTDLQPVFQSCSRLKVLKLQACKYLVDTSLDALHRGSMLPDLCELDLSYGSLCQSAIEKLLAYCPHLTHVNLNGCTNVHDLDWGLRSLQMKKHYSKSMQNLDKEFFILESNAESMDEDKVQERLLQNLNCVGCPNIKKVAISASAFCIHLTSLNLSLSVNLRNVDLSCLNLVFLNLSNCTSLETLKLDCPRLTSLLLQLCGIDEHEVEFAIQSCNSLETLDVRSCPKVTSTGISRFRTICPALKRLFSTTSV